MLTNPTYKLRLSFDYQYKREEEDHCEITSYNREVYISTIREVCIATSIYNTEPICLLVRLLESQSGNIPRVCMFPVP